MRAFTNINIFIILNFSLKGQNPSEKLTVPLREVVKNGYFTVRLTVRGGGGEGRSVPLALTVSKCENFDPFFSTEYDSMTLKTHFISL